VGNTGFLLEKYARVRQDESGLKGSLPKTSRQERNKKEVITMLVLFKGEAKGTELPPEQFFQLATKQTETLKSYKQQGKILAGGVIAGRKGSYAIFNVESIEELQGLVAQTPMYPYIEVELIPLISYEFASETAKKLGAK
jgi:muconolactone D-isomerase